MFDLLPTLATSRRIVAGLAMATLALLAFESGCGDSLGSSCEGDGDCSDGQVCASPACASSELVCLYSCSSNDECTTKAGAGSTCIDDPLGVGCIGYCSAAD